MKNTPEQLRYHADRSETAGAHATAIFCRQAADEIERAISWRNSTDVSKLADQTVRLRFELKDADLYSFQFVTKGAR